MSNVRAGDIRQFTFAGREYDPAPESNWTYNLGGFENENAVTGNGQLHTTQRRVVAGIGDAAISLDAERGDLETLKTLKDSGRAYPTTMTLTDGSTYSGELVIDGEFSTNSGEGQITLAFRGTRFSKI